MEKLIYSGKTHACPVCGRQHDKDCRWHSNEDMVLCHTHLEGEVGQEINGFHYAGPSRDTWGVWIAHELWWEKPHRPAGERRWEYFAQDHNTRLVVLNRKDDGKGGKERWQAWEAPQSEWRGEMALYRLQECQEAQKQGKVVFWVEGEPAADALWKIGIPATTSFGGCGQYRNWGKYKDLLNDDKLVLCPDRDRKGIEYMEMVEQDFPAAQWLYCEPNHPLWTHLCEGGGFDAEDWVDMLLATKEEQEVRDIIFASIGKKRSEVHRRIKTMDDYDTLMEDVGRIIAESEEQGRAEYRIAQYCQERELRKVGFTPSKLIAAYREYQERDGVLEMVSVAELMRDTTNDKKALVAGLVPSGTTILFGACGGSGKTVFTYQIAGAVATGKSIWGRKVQQGNVLVIQADEPVNSVRRKLENLGFHGIGDEIKFVNRYRQTQTWFRQVREAVKRDKIKLIVLDSVTAVTAGVGGDRTSSTAGDWMYAWRDMCQQLNCTAIFIHHLSKTGDFRDSSSYVDNVRETWKLMPSEEGGDKSKMALNWDLLIEKSNSDLQGRYALVRTPGVFGWSLEGLADEGKRSLCKSIIAKLDESARWYSAIEISNSLGQTAGPLLEQLGRMGMIAHRQLGGVNQYGSINLEDEEDKVIGIFDTKDKAMSQQEVDDAVELIDNFFREHGGQEGAAIVKILEDMNLNHFDKSRIWKALKNDVRLAISEAANKLKQAAS